MECKELNQQYLGGLYLDKELLTGLKRISDFYLKEINALSYVTKMKNENLFQMINDYSNITILVEYRGYISCTKIVFITHQILFNFRKCLNLTNLRYQVTHYQNPSK